MIAFIVLVELALIAGFVLGAWTERARPIGKSLLVADALASMFGREDEDE